ncbi:MAG: translation initiation factor IF-2 [Candidatus Portnoybacteria bacterium RIFCSPLOWO2_02_FULL_39_11]|uniref:Translation initiation factor IF-2 n=1 Tax=Candidatus Portnoybacteria bacterium RIFCSPLOWO2_02_FULL_39_11 TaxID=1802001 RepID=A0A1G2FN70_9BACT|nr:MAG: translation initiation factor IF-2 [Candidatus Portnoybacteria bacterium RIFCSPLOWO2_02_FULL_39_11]
MKKNASENGKSRPPIVVILGHVDHGKTSILDYIRQSKVAEKESGGITQHIGAYQIDHNGKLITFIDTPGHEAFSAMRSRGAKVADIAVLVVAAEEGVKPQTKEAIEVILRQNMPLIVAINKMDKPNVLPDKVKKELADNNVLVESLGGEVPAVFTSTKTGLGIDELLEMILLIAEMNNFIGDANAPAHGVIIESRMDARRGVTATLLVKGGTLTNKDIVAAESTYGQIKTMENFLGEALEKAGPSTPVLISGFGAVPPVGETWQAMNSIDEARTKIAVKGPQEKQKRESAEILNVAEGQKVFNFIVKADVFGSLEAIREVIKSVPQSEVLLRVLKAEVGNIGENDLKLAESAKAKVYGFRVKCPSNIQELADRRGVKVGCSSIIYELIQTIRHDASRFLTPEVVRQKLGQLKILEIFKVNGQQQIIGGKVASGQIERGAMADILRDKEFIGTGKIVQLQQNKKDTTEVGKDRECGIMLESKDLADKGDILEVYREEKKKREL